MYVISFVLIGWLARIFFSVLFYYVMFHLNLSVVVIVHKCIFPPPRILRIQVSYLLSLLLFISSTACSLVHFVNIYTCFSYQSVIQFTTTTAFHIHLGMLNRSKGPVNWQSVLGPTRSFCLVGRTESFWS